MTGSAFAAACDGVVLIVLCVGVVARNVPRRARIPLALAAFGSAWVLCDLVMRSHLPKWTIVPGAISIAVTMVLLVVAGQLSLEHNGGGGTDEDGGGGLDKPPPDEPLGGGSPAEPSWWPEFERDLASYQAAREQARRTTTVG